MPEKTTRVTLRLPESEMSMLDTFVVSGEYSNLSEVIRRAIREFVVAHAKSVVERVKTAEALAQAKQEILQTREIFERLK